MADDSPDDEVTAETTASEESTAEETPEAAEGADKSADTDEPAEDAPEAEADKPKVPLTPLQLGARVGLVVVVVLAGLTGWLGFTAYKSYQNEQKREMLLATGVAAARSLTSVNWESADADVQRVLDSATGAFFDDFQKRAESYLEVVKQVKSKSEGTITGSALEPVSDTEAKVLVSVTVKSTNAGVPEQAPQYWRMVLTVQENDGEAKVSDVEFIE